MADTKITDLTATTSPATTDVVPIVDLGAGATKKVTVANLVKATTPTGTGFRHVAAGVEDAAAKLVENADVHASAAIAVTKLAAGSANTVLCGGASNSFRQLVNADIDAAAAIAGSKLQAASSGNAGSMSAADKSKLDGLQTQGGAVAVGAMAIDWNAGSVFTKTLAAGANTFTFSNAASGKVIVVRVTSATAPSTSTLTWPTVRWAGGAPPTQTPSGTDVYTFVHDGTNIYGSVVQDMS